MAKDELTRLKQWIEVIREATFINPFYDHIALLIDDKTRWAVLQSLCARAMRGEEPPTVAEFFNEFKNWKKNEKA